MKNDSKKAEKLYKTEQRKIQTKNNKINNRCNMHAHTKYANNS